MSRKAAAAMTRLVTSTSQAQARARRLSRPQHRVEQTGLRQQRGGPEREHPANQPRLRGRDRLMHLGTQLREPALPPHIHLREPPLPPGVLLRKALLHLRVKAGEVELVQVPEFGAVVEVHAVKPVDELVGGLVAEFLIEMA